MFTGIITQTGTISEVNRQPEGIRIGVKYPTLAGSLSIGDSVAVDGCCLTVEKKGKEGFEAYISYQTMEHTTFARVQQGRIVNLEPALRADSRIGGHMVTGHIDSVTKILSIEKREQAYRIKIKLHPKLSPFIAVRGSVAIDGISLTVSEKKENWFAAAVIPHTYSSTNLYTRQASGEVNIEVDIIARYIANFIGSQNPEDADKLLKEKLKKHGFI
ncbi:MAG: riboflavin synthase [Actinomycetia bacterium]|nr:riboflavin synthase [Actinomycetes bacterium]